MPDGATSQPGGRDRIHLISADLAADVEQLRAARPSFRNDIVNGPEDNRSCCKTPQATSSNGSSRQPDDATTQAKGSSMSIRHLIAAADAALLGGVGLTTPAAAHVSFATGGIGIGTGSGRLGAVVAAAVGLISMVIGGLALARSAGRIGTGSGRAAAIVALAVGLIGMVLAGRHLATSTGGIGTGNGRAGAIVALVVGLIGIVLGGLALAGSRRTGGTG